MKKIFLLALLAIVSVSAFAKKTYLRVDAYNNRVYGNVPQGISGVYYEDGVGYAEYGKDYYSNDEQFLDVLANYGYEVEFMTSLGSSNNQIHYLLSKETSSSQTTSTGDVNKDGKINVSDISTLVNIILGIVRDNPSLLELSR